MHRERSIEASYCVGRVHSRRSTPDLLQQHFVSEC
jgi:hypothetical protein